MVDVRLLADLPKALDSAAPGTILNKDAGGLGFDSASYDDLGATGSIDSADVIAIANSSYLSSRISTGAFNAKNHLDSGVGNSLVPDSSGRTVRIGNYSKPINNLYLDSASTVYIGSNHSFSLSSSHIEFNGGTASSFSQSGPAVAEGNWYGDRGIAAGGYYGSAAGFRNNIDYYDITTPGNATDFGDLTCGKYGLGGISDKTYFLAPGGWEGSISDQTDGHAYTRQIDYITIATASNASAFGNLNLYNGYSANMCDGSRGVKAGGDYSLGTNNHAWVTNEISYITVTVPSNATDFGNLTTARSGPTGFSDGTYGYVAGGASASIYTTSPSSIWQNSVDVFTIQTPGNATLGGGSLDVVMRHCGGCSNATYAMWGGGRNNSNTNINNIQRMTMSTSASSTDFGDLTSALVGVSCLNNSTRAVWNGQGSPTVNNVLQYVTIDTPGNSTDFGDLVVTGGHRFSGSGNAS